MANSALDAILKGTYKPVGANKNNDNLNDILKGTYTPETRVVNPSSTTPTSSKSATGAAVENAGILFTQGFLQRGEGILDWMNDWTYNKLYATIYDWLGREDLAEQNRQTGTSFIEKDITNDYIMPNAQDKLMANSKVQSVVTPDSVLGQVSHGAGGVVFDVLGGKLLGGGSTVPLGKGASIAQKAGSFVVNNASSMFTLGTSVYGSSLQTALNEGASLEDATNYAILSSAKEMATEWIMGGVPGTNGKGFLDTLLSKTGVSKIKNGIVKTLLDYGFNVVGEGLEEGLAELLEPLIKNATYTDGEQIDMKNVFRSVIVGGLISGVIELPSTTSNVVTQVQENRQNKPVKEKKDVNYYKSKRQEVVDALREVDTADVEKVNQHVEVIEAIDKEIARQEKVEAIKSGEDIKVEQPKAPAKVVQEKTETKKEEVADTNVAKTVEKKSDEKVVAEKKVKATPKETPVIEEVVKPTNEELIEEFKGYTKNSKDITQKDINNYHKEVRKDVSLKELNELLLPKKEKSVEKVEVKKEEVKKEEKSAEIPAVKKEVPAEVTAMYDKLSPRDKVVADKLIELREAYKENPNDKKLAAQLKEYNGMASKEVKQYLFERNKALIDFKKVDKEVVEQQTQKAFEEPPTYRTELSDIDTTESDVSNLDSMSKNDLFYNANEAYESLLQSGLPGFREKALQYYKAYKDAGGKKSIAKLDEMLNEIESPSVVEEETVVEEPKTVEEYHKSRPNSSLEDSYKGKRVAEYSVKPVDDFNGKLRSDVTLDELNDGMVKLIMFNEDGTRNEYTYENKKALMDDIKKSYGGWKQLGDSPKAIMSTQGEFYLERDKYIKGGWKWIDANGDLIKGQESADIGQRHRKMMEEKIAEVKETGEVPAITVETLEETPVKNVNIAAETDEPVITARLVGGELVADERQLSRFADRFINTVKEEELLSEEMIVAIDNAYLYDVAHNQDTLIRAQATIDEIGFDEALREYLIKSDDDILSLDTTALGAELLHRALVNEDTVSINKILPILTMQRTVAGQIAQYTKIHNLLTGEQRLITIQKTINKIKNEKIKGSENMVITDKMVEKILKAGDDKVALDKAVEEITQELGSTLKATGREKVAAWRYFSMLNNLTTHINNVSNNFVNRNILKRGKDIIGATIEGAVRKFAPDTFKDTVRSENEVYVTTQDKQRLKEIREYIEEVNTGIERNDYKNSLVLRKEKERIINKLKGEVKMKEIHNEINSIWKELNFIDKHEKQASEIRIEDGQQSDNQISMQNKKSELIKIKDRLEAKLPKSYSTKTWHRSSKDVMEFSEIYLNKNKEAFEEVAESMQNKSTETSSESS